MSGCVWRVQCLDVCGGYSVWMCVEGIVSGCVWRVQCLDVCGGYSIWMCVRYVLACVICPYLYHVSYRIWKKGAKKKNIPTCPLSR